MSDDALIRAAFVGVEVNADHSEAVVRFGDNSRLEFCHRVGQRTVQAVGAGSRETLAGRILVRIAGFRLNGKHLDVAFADGSRWELLFGQRPMGTEPSR